MTRLVLAHIVHSIVNGIVAKLFGTGGNLLLPHTGTILGINSHLQVGLGIGGDDFTEKLCETSRMIGLFEGDALIGFGNLGKTFTISLTAHRQIHPDLGTFTDEIGAQPLKNFSINILGHTDTVLIGPGKIARLLFKFIGTDTANGAGRRGSISFVNVTTDLTNKLLHVCVSLCEKCIA